jgi:hypothetical protein
LSELELLDKLHQAELQQQQQQQQQQQPSSSSSSGTGGGGGWFSQLVGSITGSSGGSSSQQKELTPAQKARRAAAARHVQARQELGAPPAPPAAPQGLYVYGSVGSGKSLLMDLFYDTARQELQLDHSRRCATKPRGGGGGGASFGVLAVASQWTCFMIWKGRRCSWTTAAGTLRNGGGGGVESFGGYRVGVTGLEGGRRGGGGLYGSVDTGKNSLINLFYDQQGRSCS